MNILLINHYAGSPRHGMEYRPYYLAREWVRHGHEVRIVAASTSHVRNHQPQLSGDRLTETIDGIGYEWYRTPAYNGNGIGRVRNMAAFVARLYRESGRIAQEFAPDIVIASSTYPMDIWPARRIARLAGAKLIFEVHDLWPLSPMELGGMSRWHPFIMMVQAAEDYAYRHADIVVSMLPKVEAYMVSRGLDRRKLHIIPNGIDPDEWHSDQKAALAQAPAEQLAALRAQGKVIVGYAGSHGVANALEGALDAAKLLQNEDVAFVLVGDGPDKPALQRRQSNEGLKNVVFLDPVKKAQIPSFLDQADIAFIGLQRQPLFRFGIAPNKLMDYMMAGRPVLMAIDAGNDPVSDAGCGLTVRPEDPQAIADGIRRLLAIEVSERAAMGARGRDYVLSNHTYPVLAEQFLEVMNDVRD